MLRLPTNPREMYEIIVLQRSEHRKRNVRDNEYPGDCEDDRYRAGSRGSGSLIALQHGHCKV